MKKLNLFLLVLFICNCPVVSGYAFFDRDIRLLTMQDGLADNTITSIYKDRYKFLQRPSKTIKRDLASSY
jgi:hypothetical protein